jgi:hypothetical protein
MDYYFTTNGEPFTGNTDTGDDAVAKGTAVKKTGIADGTEPWRLSLDGSVMWLFLLMAKVKQMLKQIKKLLEQLQQLLIRHTKKN